MRFLSSIITLSVLTFSIFANAGLIEKGCFQEKDRKYGPYIVEVSVYTDHVIVNYTSSVHGNLGGYSGRIYSASELKKTSRGVSVAKVTLNDGADGFIDNASIEITKNTVTFDSKNSLDGAKPRVQCPNNLMK